MKPGTVVEYIDQQKIIVAAVLELKNNRLTLLNEYDQEVNQSMGRLSFVSDSTIDMDGGRDEKIRQLKETASLRQKLKESLDLKSLWELLNEEPSWIDLATMTEYCFEKPVNSHQKSAVIRALFENRLYFKFDNHRFLPHTVEQVEKIQAREEEERKKRLMIEKGGNWIKSILNEPSPCLTDEFKGLGEILKSLYVHEKESRFYEIGKAILSHAGISSPQVIFKILVKLGIFKEDENIDIHRLGVQTRFTEKVLGKAREIRENPHFYESPRHDDFSHVKVITIDGQSTTDYDDALSLERIGDSFILGIHISDVAHVIERDDPIDRQALTRGATIYMADDKIPMLPPDISEYAASLVQGEPRPCISVLVTLNRFFEIKDYDIIPTRITVTRQLTYSEASAMAETDADMAILVKIARAFREKRLSSGATHITLPEVNVYLDDDNTIKISRVDRESPSRMLVAELMIMANWLMAGFLSRNSLPAIFRSQHEPKERLYKGETDSLFLNCLQRKFVNRAIISHKASFHAGLGLDAYVTATSPIRRYHDLVTQRQIKAALGLCTPYTDKEISQISQMLETPIASVGRIQFTRRRYWLIKYLESSIGEKTPGLVIDKKRNSYQVLLTDFMLEYNLPSSGLNLKPQDLITLVIQNANARKDSFSVFMSY